MFAMDKKLNTMGKRLTAARKAKGFSRPELAAKVPVSRAAIKQWEDDAVKGIRPAHLLSVCDELGVEVQWLVHGTGPRAAKRSAEQRTREARWVAIADALSTERGDQLLSFLENRIQLEAAGLLPATLDDEDVPALEHRETPSSN